MNAVDLTANLSDLELEQIEDQGGEIWFVVDGDDGRDRQQVTPDPRRQPGRRKQYAGEYRVKVELRLHGKKPRHARPRDESITSSDGMEAI